MWFYQRLRLPLSLFMGAVFAVSTVTNLFCVHQPRADARNYIRVETDRDVYAIGEPAKITPVIVNESGDPATYTMAYVVKVFDAEETVIWEREMVAYGKITIPACSEGKLDTFIWDQRDKAGNQISPGRYRIFIRLFEYRYRNIQGEQGIRVR
jgi:hypothetical protein